jgi:hypothetical protein
MEPVEAKAVEWMREDHSVQKLAITRQKPQLLLSFFIQDDAIDSNHATRCQAANAHVVANVDANTEPGGRAELEFNLTVPEAGINFEEVL